MRNKAANPYRPGAGTKPLYLAGRDDELQNISDILEALKLNIPTQSIIYSGLRGVGKTVLLNAIESLAEEKGIFTKHIEVEERNDFIPQITACAQGYLRNNSVKNKIDNLVNKAIDSIKALSITYNPSDSTFSLSVQEKDLYTSTSLTQSLTDVMTSIGEIALKTERPICFFIDEIQYMKQEELNALIAAVHRTNQLGYPIVIVGAGLPKIYAMLSNCKSYSERLFIYKTIDSLNEDSTEKAIREPAKKVNVIYKQNAINKISEITHGYPFFIQQFCKILFENVLEDEITLDHVHSCIEQYYNELDNGFFRVRYERCSRTDKLFIFAMVKCGELPCTIGNVAKFLHKSVNTISPSRAQLISKGIIYPVRFKEIDFTVPDFDLYIKRLDEYNEWLNEN